MSHLFQPDRSLLYPQFETYRLHSLDPNRDVSTYSLPGSGATQARVGHNSHLLSFKETRARIAFDHLATDGHRRGCYVDKEWNVIGLQVDDNLIPTFTTLASLPTPVSSSSSTQQSEYPCALNLSPTLWILSTGSGSLYLLQTTPPSEPSFTGSLVARYDLTSPDGSSGQAFPFVLRNAHQVSDTEVKLLLSRSNAAGGKGQSKQTTFELLEFSLNPTQTNGVDDDPRPLKLNWRNVGGDLPLWTTWSRDGWLVLSGETYGPPVDAGEEDEGEKAKRERREAIEKLGLGATVSLSTDTESNSASVGGLDVDMGDEEARDWPFSWKQNSDSLSISVSFAPGTARNHLSVGLTSTSFSLSVSPEAPSTSEVLDKFLSKPSRSFWSEIDPSTSTWTFDPSRSVLDLDIVKVDTDVRWPSVFIPADGDDDMDDEEDVPESLDAAILASVRETFNRIKTRSEDEPAGNHPAIPALIREEMDYDLEDGEDFGESTAGVFGEPGGGGKVGRDIFVGFIKDGQASFTKAQSSIISLPLAAQSEAVMVKSAVDGMLFSPPIEGSLVKTPWKHQATSPAISFVLSSKRDLRVVRHLNTESGPIVMAFDAGGSTPASGNVYVYYPPTSSTTARQGVVRVSGADRGALLGVGAVNVSGKTIPVALCEKEFVVLHGLEG